MKRSIITIAVFVCLFIFNLKESKAQQVKPDSILPDPIDLRVYNHFDHTQTEPDSAIKAILYRKGVDEAEGALAHDSLIIKQYSAGYPRLSNGWNKYIDILKKRFGIFYNTSTSDTFSTDEAQIIWGAYDSVMTQAIIKRFGIDVTDTTIDHVNDRYPKMILKNYRKYKFGSYTNEALRDSIQGEVYVRFGVTQDGLPKDLKVVRSLGHGLDKIALQNVNKLRLVPAKIIETDTVMFYMSVPIYFRLPKSHE